MSRDLGGELTGLIIGAAIAVHRELGPGLKEANYEKAFGTELLSRGIAHSAQRPLPLAYKRVKLDCGYRMDVVIERRLVIELKSVETILPVHESQLLTYLRLSSIELGLLLNFDVPILKEGIRRRALSLKRDTSGEVGRDWQPNGYDATTSLILQAAFEVHRNLGQGLLRSSYEAALCYELSKRRLSFERNKDLPIHFRELQIDAEQEIDLLVNDEVPVVCLSLNVIKPVDRARLESRLRQGNWKTGLILNFNVPLFEDGIYQLVNQFD